MMKFDEFLRTTCTGVDSSGKMHNRVFMYDSYYAR